MKHKVNNQQLSNKAKMRQQYAALPYAVRNGELVVMLVTSRETRRWIIPKGWPAKNLRGHEVAELEAFEEAGIVGEASPTPCGSFQYFKRIKPTKQRHCHVDVYAMAVRAELEDWPEKGQRERVWLTPMQAAERVSDVALVDLLLNFSSVVGVAA